MNPELSGKTLGQQEIIQYDARDGQKIEGLLMHPVGYEDGKKYPLVVYVHGGPESHHSNGWLSRYSTPGQVMAGKGYLVLYLNYRASTGYGVDFGMEGLMDPAGKEFDDIADGIEYLIQEKGADPDRVGMAGGSYGGYASGWFATYYTRYVKAVCMFVGISDLISKRGTTDIPYEEMYVHSGKLLEEQWQMNLERSPIYWAHQSKTATLIYGGTEDTRVHPSQSLELYRRMKMNNHPAVRLVQYPGEKHGNSKQTGRIDVLYRQIEWLDWYVRDLNPLDGPMPSLDISDKYGLDRNVSDPD
jgi:dipeptidyl aminopeptidase/acylaminoacyl peptidase